ELLPFTNKEALASTIPAKQNEIDESIINKNKTEAEAVVQSTPEDDKKSIFEAIDEQDADNPQTIVADQQNNGKWTMGPAVAPVYYAAMGEGSPIHSNFSSNSKSGNINLSYGLTVSYQLGNKLSVRSGIHKVDYGYDTEDVLFSSSLLASTNQLIDNINYSQTSRNLVVQSKAKTNALPSDLSNREVLATNPTLDGRMVQQLGYVEVPFELNYAILDAKFGLNIIGGVSSLFLVDNAVTLESNGLITEMGEANNVNNLNFSTNIGLGLNYQFTPKIQLSMEPIFKYQLNTFSETAGDFRPYSVGVYSGVRYKF
ncbi:MAG: outer membrane beta-barrel protein, partial [Croceitalea sp.]|nr:outer membrane beta-barrel protein [Croceitalea sp.]